MRCALCGICGTAGFADKDLLERMTAVITHRGPDDGGIYLSPDRTVGLGNRRLSIIDLSPAGHMPMSNAEGTIRITYNGEVYNFPELRRLLEARGHQFRSGTDTETILRLYEDEGSDAFQQLNGMFAFALWDARQRELWLVRDRLGIKPLYYTEINGSLLFASEIKSLLLDPRVRREIDPEALHYFLAHLWTPGPGTMFKNIYKLPPGHYLRWRDGRSEVRPYWQLRWTETSQASTEEYARELRAILERAVQRHLIADVPVGLFLSGGLDSSILLGLMSQITQTPAEAYTIAFRNEDARLEQAAGADEHYAELVAQHFGARFHRLQVDPNVVDLLPRVLWHLDEPVADPAAITTLLIAEAARPQVTVLLSGQGADEVFAGYRVHLVERFAQALARLPQKVRSGILQPGLSSLPWLADHIPGIHPGLVMAFHRYFSKVLAGVDMSPEERYLFNRSYYSAEQQLSLYHPDVRQQFVAFDSGRRHSQYFAEASDTDFVNRMLHVDLKTFLPELNLTYGDKLTMAASVEMRVPFLDNELVEFMAGVPPHLKIRGLTSKYLLRRAVADLLPPAILKRRKAGFGAPIRRWLETDLVNLVDDLLSPETIRARGYFDPVTIRRLIENDRKRREDHAYRIWALLTLEMWMRLFIDRPVITPTHNSVFVCEREKDGSLTKP